MIEFDTHIGQLEYLMNVHYLFVPSHIVEEMGGIKSGRWVCKLSPGISFQCGLVSLSDGNAYITLNKQRLKSMGAKLGDEVHVRLEKDETEFGMDMCEELRELLDQDDEGRERFEQLKKGMQRYIIYYVSQVKNPDLRIKRAVLLIGNLKLQTPGKETFRAMLGK